MLVAKPLSTASSYDAKSSSSSEIDAEATATMSPTTFFSSTVSLRGDVWFVGATTATRCTSYTSGSVTVSDILLFSTSNVIRFMLSIVNTSLSSSSVRADDSSTTALRTATSSFSRKAVEGATTLCSGSSTTFSPPSGITTGAIASMYTIVTAASKPLAM